MICEANDYEKHVLQIIVSICHKNWFMIVFVEFGIAL